MAESDPDRGHVGGAAPDEVALVVPGRDGAVLAEVAERALDSVALLVRDRVEGRRPPLLPRFSRLATWPDGSGMVALIPRPRR